MSEPRDANAVLLARLAALVEQVDPAPDLVYDLGRRAYDLRRLDDELAALVADSALAGAGVRADPEAALARPRLVEFATDALVLALQIRPGDGAVTLLGELSGPAAEGLSAVTAESVDGSSRTVEVDAYGRFTVEGLTGAAIRLRCVAAGTPVATSWLPL